MATHKSVKSSKKIKKVVNAAIAHINASRNNTIITVTDKGGNAIAWATAGGSGFKGSRKKTPFAAGVAAERVAAMCKEFGVKEIDVRVRGSGNGRESAIRTLEKGGLRVTNIKDVSGIPHNGVRPPKARRV